VFLDEAGFQIGSVAGTTWGLCGGTPVLPCHGRGWGKVNAAPGLIVSPGVRRHPRLCFRLFEANINGALFALFVRDLLREVRKRPTNPIPPKPCLRRSPHLPSGK